MNARIINTPAGRLELLSRDGKLCAIRPAQQSQDGPCTPSVVLDETERQLAAYFAGERKAFDLPLLLEGSSFDRAVWRQLLTIAFGEIRTYGEIAAALGKPKASRAVGGACSRNPLLIVVPCHRVIAGTGKLTGFAAGLEMKRTLLAHEGHSIQNDKMMK